MQAFLFVLFIVLGTTAAKISISDWMHGSNLKLFYWIIGSGVYKPFGMRNGCRVNSRFILYARQPCI